jgi:hypothetical protein
LRVEGSQYEKLSSPQRVRGWVQRFVIVRQQSIVPSDKTDTH